MADPDPNFDRGRVINLNLSDPDESESGSAILDYYCNGVLVPTVRLRRMC